MKKLKNRQEVFLGLYDAYSEAIFRHCYFRVYNRELARDLMQETLLRVWKYSEQGNKIKNHRAFIYRVANNLITDEFRKKRELSLDDLHEKGFNPGITVHETWNNIIEGKNMIALLQGLDRKYRDVIIMRYIDGLTPKEIATIIHETGNGVSVRIHRGLKQLRKLLEQGLGGALEKTQPPRSRGL